MPIVSHVSSNNFYFKRLRTAFNIRLSISNNIYSISLLMGSVNVMLVFQSAEAILLKNVYPDVNLITIIIMSRSDNKHILHSQMATAFRCCDHNQTCES